MENPGSILQISSPAGLGGNGGGDKSIIIEFSIIEFSIIEFRGSSMRLLGRVELPTLQKLLTTGTGSAIPWVTPVEHQHSTVPGNEGSVQSTALRWL